MRTKLEHGPRLPPRYALRLEDLRAWHVVRVSCEVCRHKGEIAPAALGRGQPGYTRLVDLEGRLRCRNCGARGRASLVVDLRPRD
jgi:formate dehydrogenase maturation protein FdhE